MIANLIKCIFLSIGITKFNRYNLKIDVLRQTRDSKLKI